MNIQKTKLSRPATEHRASAGAASLVAALLLLGATTAHAGTEGNNFYAGFSATMESFDADYDKATVNGSGSPRGANSFHSDDSEDETMHGLGVFAGYWWPVGAGGAWFGAELDYTHHGGTVQGVLPENPDTAPGAHAGTNEYGESWSENWSYEKERSYGLTFKLAMPLEAMGAGASVYALAGYRRAKTRMHLSYAGCGATACAGDPAEDLEPGTFNRDATVTGWTAGAGFEKMLGEDTAFRGELRYTDYETNRWVSVPPGPGGAAPDPDVLRVPASVDSDEVGVSLGLVRYF